MVKAEFKGEPEVVLTLTQSEAKVLRAVLGGMTGGWDGGSPRWVVDAIYRSLSDIGIKTEKRIKSLPHLEWDTDWPGGPV